MTDEVLNIKVTEAELNLIMDLLHEAGIDRLDADGQPAIEICHDLMEQSAALLDGWSEPEVTEGDLIGDEWSLSAEAMMIQAGISGRENQKQTSQAAERRALNFSARDDRPRSETQQVDLWDANDPKNW